MVIPNAIQRLKNKKVSAGKPCLIIIKINRKISGQDSFYEVRTYLKKGVTVT
jgi:hypothetical protein